MSHSSHNTPTSRPAPSSTDLDAILNLDQNAENDEDSPQHSKHLDKRDSITNGGYSSDGSNHHDRSPQHSPSFGAQTNENSSLIKSTSPSASSSSSSTRRLRPTKPKPSWRDYFQGKSLVLIVYSSLLLISSVANSIYFKQMINHMTNYVYFLNQLTAVAFIPVFFSLVWYELWFTNSITPEMQAFSKKKFIWMGLFDSVSGVLCMFGAVHTSGSMQALLGNSVIPITMLLSYFILKQKFRVTQIIGATVIMSGIVFVLLPQFMSKIFAPAAAPTEPITAPSGAHDSHDPHDSSAAAPAAPAAEPSADIPLFNLLFIASAIPGALSSIYKELAFVDADIDANYLQAWVCLSQLFMGLFLVPFNTLSFLGNQAIPWNRLVSSLSDGFFCMLGYDTIIPPHCTLPHEIPSETLPPCDHCAGAWIPLTIYLCCNLLFNMFTVLLIKHGSATLMFIIMTLRLPLVQITFTMKIFNDPPDTLHWYSGVGLAVILTGLVLYRWPSKTKGGINQEDDTIMPIMGGERRGHDQIFSTLHHAKYVRLRRSAHQIRSALYSTLGVIDSPPTPYSPRRFSPGTSSRSNNDIAGPSSRSPAQARTPPPPRHGYGSTGGGSTVLMQESGFSGSSRTRGGEQAAGRMASPKLTSSGLADSRPAHRQSIQ